MGLFVVALGIQMFLKTSNTLYPLGGIVLGGLLGEWLKIEEGFSNLGAWLEKKSTRNHSSAEKERFIRGFITASILFCAGPVAILGSIQDGAQGNPQLLIVKSILDGFFALSFASTMGIGVAFSAIPVLAYQAILSLLGGQLQSFINAPMMNELSAVGGVVLMGCWDEQHPGCDQNTGGEFHPFLIHIPPAGLAVPDYRVGEVAGSAFRISISSATHE